jgi:hypothetical protein
MVGSAVVIINILMEEAEKGEKRLKYTKEILTHMLNGTNVPPNAGENDLNP